MRTYRSLDTARSFLFVPGDSRHKIDRALASEADALIIDLEDGIHADHRQLARGILIALSSSHPAPDKLICVRINGVDSGGFAADVECVLSARVDAVVVPKMTTAAASVGELGLPVIALIETATGLLQSERIARIPRVQALMLGGVDLALELGLPDDADSELISARFALAAASAASGLRPPIDQIYARIADVAGLERECLTARRLGFRGKACIHPNHVSAINSVFTPNADEVLRAKRIVNAYERAHAEGIGAVEVDGRMVDAPVVELARRTLREAGAV